MWRTVLVLALAAGAAAAPPAALAYHGLAECPALAPANPLPVTGRPARDCRTALVRGGRSYVRDVLELKAACLDRIVQGEVADDPAALCRGLRRLSTGTIDLPTDADTGATVSAAAETLATEIGASCTDAVVTDLGIGADTTADATAALVADHWEHVEHILDQLYGPAGEMHPIADAGAGRCHAAVAKATVRFVTKQHAAMASCVERRHARRDRGRLGELCLGEVTDGVLFEPRDPATALRVRRAVARLGRTIGKRCRDATLAALDLCGDDRASVLACLVCVGCREAMLLLGTEAGGTPGQSTAPFIDWAALRNPILGFDDRRLKDQAVAYQDGRFYLFSSTGFADDDPDATTKEQSFFRTNDFLAFEPFRDDGLNPPGSGIGSPDLTEIDGVWRMVFQLPDPELPDNRRLFLTASTDLTDWSAPVELVPDVLPDQSIIDGALIKRGDFFFLGFKWRQPQLFYVTRSETPALDQRWLPAERALAPIDDFFFGFAENFQFVEIDGRLRMIATARDPEGVRCPNLFTCSHEPFIYDVASGDGSAVGDWRLWDHKTQLRIPYESWNPVMHANTGFLNDWREHDGFFYLSYSGSLDSESFEGRGHDKIGLARSRDLVHWRVAGDLRD